MAVNPASFVAYLKSIAGKGAISMQFTEIKGISQIQPGGAIYQIQQQTGKWLGGVGGDYWWFGSTSKTADTTFNNLAVEYWKQQGIVTLIFSMPNPVTGGPSSDTTPVNFDTLFSNQNFITTLTSIGNGLLDLKARGVQAIATRFCHELNGNWFWWGVQSSGDFAAFWKKLHAFLLAMGCDNLVKVWSVNAGLNGMPVGGRYPGDDQVDVVGMDVYTSQPTETNGDYQTLLKYNKPIMLCEYGSGSPSTWDPGFSETTLISCLKGPQKLTTSWQQWWQPWGIETAQQAKAALTDPWVLNRGDLGALFGGITPTPVPTPSPTPAPASPDPTVITTAGPVINDGLGNKWSLSGPNGAVLLNGNNDQDTSNVITVAWTGGLIYAENGDKLWWSKTGPTAAWVPPQGSPNSPLVPLPTPTPTPAPTPTPTPSPVTHQTVMAKVAAAQSDLTAAQKLLDSVMVDLPKLSP